MAGDPTMDDTLAYVQQLFTTDLTDVARLAGDGLAMKAQANQHPEAKIPAMSTFWDEMLDVTVQIEQQPGLLEDVLTSLGQTGSQQLGQIFANYMQFNDRISYDPNNLNGPPINLALGGVPGNMQTPVDRSAPDTGFNRSAFFRFLSLIHDTNGVTTCNKPGAIVIAQGIPLLGTANVCSGGLCSLGSQPFQECAVFKIENLAKFYLDSIVGKADLDFRSDFLKSGILGIGAATVGLVEQSSNIGYTSDTSQQATINQEYGFWDATTAKTFHPRPQWLNRLVFFNQATDDAAPTQQFLANLNGPHIASSVCTPRPPLTDPCLTSSDCKDATDIDPNGITGLYDCTNQPNDWLDVRGADTIFVWEQFGFYGVDHAVAERVHQPRARGPLHRSDGDVVPALGRHAGDRGRVHVEPRSHAEVPAVHQGRPGDVRAAARAGFPGRHHPRPARPRITLDDAHHPALHGDRPTSNSARPSRRTTASPCSRTRRARWSILSRRMAIGPRRSPRELDRFAERRDDQPAGDADLPAHRSVEQHGRGVRELPEPQSERRPPLAMETRALAARRSVPDGRSTGTRDRARRSTTPAIDEVRPDADRHPSRAALRELSALVRAPFARCAWARDQLTTELANVIHGPTFAATMDVLDAMRLDTSSRAQMGSLLQYLLDDASQNEALPSLLATTNDIIQVMKDDTNLVPLYNALAAAFEPTQTNAQGQIHPEERRGREPRAARADLRAGVRHAGQRDLLGRARPRTRF